MIHRLLLLALFPLLLGGQGVRNSGSGVAGDDNQIASEVPFTPAGDVAATDTQAAIEEVDAEKAPLSHAHAGADITSGVVAPARGGLGADATAFTADAGIFWNGTTFAEMAGSDWDAGTQTKTFPNLAVTTTFTFCAGCTGVDWIIGRTDTTAANSVQALSGDADLNAEAGYFLARTSATTDGAEQNQILFPSSLGYWRSYQNATRPTANTNGFRLAELADDTPTDGNYPTYNADGRLSDGVAVIPAADIDTSITRTIASGTAALGTALIATETCATVVTAAATGVVAATDVVSWSFVGSVNAVTGYVPVTEGGLRVAAYAGTDQINIDVCNPTAASITPAALSVAWRVQR